MIHTGSTLCSLRSVLGFEGVSPLLLPHSYFSYFSLDQQEHENIFQKKLYSLQQPPFSSEIENNLLLP